MGNLAYELVLVSFTCLVIQVHGYPDFQKNIPNGQNVPSPCGNGEIWQGVGHENKNGGGTRNPFGKDFKANGYTWTEELCQKDSDGDGRTNGEELGDPECKWYKGQTPQYASDLSHPGVCEPLDSATCAGKNSFLDCTSFECDALNDPDVFGHTVKLDTSPVPAEVTTYMCQNIDLPMDRDYHLIATKPSIDNVNVMHHVLVYGCTGEAEISDEQRQPNKCFMNRIGGCNDIIGIWSLGNDGVCYHGDAGFLIGKSGYKSVNVEVHWNNPMMHSDYTDGSGLTLYLTPNLRPYTAGMLTIGQMRLFIPPNTAQHTVTSKCNHDCIESRMNGPIHFVGALNHMHYLGSSAASWMSHPDMPDKKTYLAYDEVYEYDRPVFYIMDKPVTMNPGHALEMACHFDSRSRDKTTMYGEGTHEEMCFAFLMYYPKENLTMNGCISTGPMDRCSDDPGVITKGCNLQEFYDQSNPVTQQRNQEIFTNCRYDVCLEECKTLLRTLLEHPCMAKEFREIYKFYGVEYTTDQNFKVGVMEFWMRIESCIEELTLEACEDGDGGWTHGPVSGVSGSTALANMLLVSIAVARMLF